MKIAIIGTGIAGNVAAAKLQRNHDVTVFESSDYVGGHSNTVFVDDPAGPLHIDTGFMVFNERTYPEFTQLIKELGVPVQDTEMSFSVRNDQTSLEYSGTSLNTLFAQRRNLFRPAHYRLLSDILRFNRESRPLLDSARDVTLAQYLAENGYSKEFVNSYLIPMGAAIWSARPVDMQKMPAPFFVRFFENHGLLDLKDRPQWKTICGGSQSYVRKLVADHRDRIRLSDRVSTVTRLGEQVRIETAKGFCELFDYAVLACHSDQAMNLLKNPLPVEREILGAIPYQRNEAVLHSDASVLPHNKRAWASWNYHVPGSAQETVTVNYNMNKLQRLRCETPYIVTLNGTHRVREDRIIKTFQYEHPVFTARGLAAQARHTELNQSSRVLFCGAYWRNGFHEDGVVSALDTVRLLEARIDSEQRDFQRAS